MEIKVVLKLVVKIKVVLKLIIKILVYRSLPTESRKRRQ